MRVIEKNFRGLNGLISVHNQGNFGFINATELIT